MQTVETLSAGKSMETSKRRTAWLVVAASSVDLFLHFGSLLVNAFGVMLTTLASEFSWSRGDVSFAFLLATMGAMLTMPLTGWLTDKFGARRPIFISMIGFGALYASLSFLTPNLWHLYAVFLLLGLFGPGTSAVPHASLISRWFTERRGLALGLAMSGTAIGGVIWPCGYSVADGSIRLASRLCHLRRCGLVNRCAIAHAVAQRACRMPSDQARSKDRMKDRLRVSLAGKRSAAV